MPLCGSDRCESERSLPSAIACRTDTSQDTLGLTSTIACGLKATSIHDGKFCEPDFVTTTSPYRSGTHELNVSRFVAAMATPTHRAGGSCQSNLLCFSISTCSLDDDAATLDSCLLDDNLVSKLFSLSVCCDRIPS